MDNDEGVLSRSDQKTREGLHKILGCCRQTLDNLDAFVNQYQEIRRPDETGGLAVQRSWKHILIKNWKMIWWTTEGGSVQSLRNMLAMHVQSIMLTMQALQRSGEFMCPILYQDANAPIAALCRDWSESSSLWQIK